jgi:hypothetical protein
MKRTSSSFRSKSNSPDPPSKKPRLDDLQDLDWCFRDELEEQRADLPVSDGEREVELDEGGEEEEQAALFDVADEVWRCSKCLWETYCGVCDKSGTFHEVNKQTQARDAEVLPFSSFTLTSPIDSRRTLDHVLWSRSRRRWSAQTA